MLTTFECKLVLDHKLSLKLESDALDHSATLPLLDSRWAAAAADRGGRNETVTSNGL